MNVHLRSDVPTALLLSSGLDSGALAWAAAELGQKLTCVTVEMGGGRDESAGAAAIASRFGHQHVLAVSPPGADRVESFFESMQRPSIDGLNTFLVSHAIADEGFKVALSGMGADEVLGGYHSFRWLRALPVLRAGDRIGATRPASSVLDAAGLSRRWPKVRDLIDPEGPRDSAGLSRLSRRVLPAGDIQRLLPSASIGAATRNGRMDGRALSEAARLFERIDHAGTLGNHRLIGQLLLLQLMHLVAEMVAERLLFLQLVLQPINFGNIALTDDHADQLVGVIKQHRRRRRDQLAAETVLLQQADHVARPDRLKGGGGEDHQPFPGGVEIMTTDELFGRCVVDTF